ncbi:zinc-dependent metalloprotease family protein [Euzebya rosea]|uniref:zinc-dependent metalloprotease family protein n=1 Tax=Euzebya rosea TaxID=2052804 RepID=UPI000D3E9726|nr:zinc-dependent metalloprotease family protein [Euzebya rosea]
MTRTRSFATALVTLAIALLALPSGASPRTVAAVDASADPGVAGAILDLEAQQVDCDGAQLTGPDSTSVAHVTGEAESITLEVLLVLDTVDVPGIAALDDGTDAGRAAHIAAGDALFADVVVLLEVAPQPYAELGIDLVWAGWDLLDATVADLAGRTTESQEIIDLARGQYGGVRPDAVDIVYVATDADIQALGQTAVAGQADCIGGVGNPENAFAVGEIGDALVDPKGGIPISPVTFYRDFAAKVAAHEIGHLMGGHHHYQECATPGPVTSAVARAEIGACTLMSNAVDFQTLPFGTLNGVVVRGHAEAYADR